jgi:Cysteine-rich CPXCG
VHKKKSRIHRARKTARDLGDDAAINALYGLEPVFEPGLSTGGGLTEIVALHCPYCDETFAICVDLSAGSCSYIEDCQVCCQPVEIGCEIDAKGALQAVKADRSD